MSDESKKYISVIFKEWLPLYDGLKPEVKAILKNIAAEQSEALAARFYDFIFQDPDIARHLTYDLVQERLSRSLAVWVNDILTSEKDQLQALAERQYHIGSIHARIGIPAEAVLRGARQLKAGLIEYVRDNDKIDHQTGLATIHYAVMAINMAIEMMCHAYTLSHYRATKNEEAFRLYSLMDNVPMEYGKQQVSLSGWENSAIFNIVSENKSDINGTLLSESEFGLWFRHKCVRYFNKNPQMQEIADLISKVDALLSAWKSSSEGSEYKNTQALLQGIHINCQQIGSQMGVLFSSLSQMQSGKDTLTSLLNRRYLPVVLKHEVTLAMEYELPMTVAIVDIDHFKEINDNWGHATGDKVLIEVASRLMNFVSKHHQAWRLGGDEFAILLRDVHSEAEVKTLCTSLSSQFLEPFNLHNGHTATLSLSIGYALAWEHASAENLQEFADQNMYRMKHRRIPQVQK